MTYSTARAQLKQLASGVVSSREAMALCLERIEQCNPDVNAVCTLVSEEDALHLADSADERRSSGSSLGPLHGLPMAVKRSQ